MSGRKRSTKRQRPARDDDREGYKSRAERILELTRGSIVTVIEGKGSADADVRLELYVKEKSRGEDYVADFVYSDPRLPVTVSGVLLHTPAGLIVGELELFRVQWGYFDDYGDYVGPEGDWRGKDDEDWDVTAHPDSPEERQPFAGITGGLLRAARASAGA
jgi:hypothetical protein